MIQELDKAKIVEIAERYGVTSILLFGSSLREGDDARDIDLAVRGLQRERFFKFYGELIMALSKPVDLLDLDKPSEFSRLVVREGVAIYG